jgi:epoxyqueuosine reductase
VSPTELKILLIQKAHEAGFPLASTIDLDLAEQDLSPQSIHTYRVRYSNWIKNGFSGAMTYLARGQARREQPTLILPDAKSLLCVALPYSARAAGAPSASTGPRYARYIRGRDYHEEISEKLESAMQHVQHEWLKHSPFAPLQWKICVDSSAVLERSWAALAGLGWIGKNTLLIHPQYGSYLFLGVVILSEKTDQGPQPLLNYCGNCTRCLTACPTQAFVQPGVLDATQCISYWTLEKRGELPISTTQKQKIGPWIAGCDICQEVCPFNQKATRKAEKQEAIDLSITDDKATLQKTWIDLLKETTLEYQTRVKHSALNRIKPAQFSRNLAILLSNALPGFSKAELDSLLPLIQHRFEIEIDSVAQQEWRELLVTITRYVR